MTASCRSLYALAIFGLFLANTAHAQAASDSISPRPGSWAAEANYGDSDGASLLYFSSSHAAWVLRANFNVGSETQDEPQLGFGGTTTTTSTTSTVGGVSLQLGGRWWSGEPTARLRPFTGLGVIGQYSAASNSRTSAVGAYGELGATYFFSPHVSLGAAGELDLTSAHNRYGSDDSTLLKTSAWRFSGNLVRFMATVYF
jgi:hypothetical protein